MKRYFGLLVSEIFTLVLAIVVVLAVGFGMHVSAERDDRVERAQTSLKTLKERVAAAVAAGEPVACDASMVDASVLANDFLTLSIGPVPIDKRDRNAGYTAGLLVKSNREADGNDTFVTAERLLENLKEIDKEEIRVSKKEDDEIEYAILLSDQPACANS